MIKKIGTCKLKRWLYLIRTFLWLENLYESDRIVGGYYIHE